MVERETPMDRLICGDVGFGKTEVALRAMFRVFSAAGKQQVMVLAPTTVLARQHYHVICERFADYKARIALLSRFQTMAEKRKLAMEIRAGTLDIIVGTHALFGSNIHYSNLGLLVVDEEQERPVALEECCDLGRGFNLAERDLAIRGFGSIFGEKQSGEVAHIGMDLFFDMLFETLSKADHHVFFQYDFTEVKLDLELHHHIPSDYIQNPQKYESVISELEVAASSGIRELMYLTNNLRCDFGRETPSFEVLLKAVYIRRLAADLGIYHIWVRAKTVIMETGMSAMVFKILQERMTSDSLQSSLRFNEGVIELLLLVKLPPNRLTDRIFACLVDLRKGLSHFAKQK